MASLDFYAVNEDITRVIDFVLDSGYVVYETYSGFDQELRQFSSAPEVWAAYEEKDFFPGVHAMLLSLLHKSVAGKVLVRRIDLVPESCNGHTFRYCVEGWGLMNLHFGGICHGKIITSSHFGHNSEKRAQKWQFTYPEYGATSAWDWKEIAKLSRSIQYQIKNKLSASKSGSSPVLMAASRLQLEQGYELLMN